MSVPNINDLDISPQLARVILVSYGSIFIGLFIITLYNHTINTT